MDDYIKRKRKQQTVKSDFTSESEGQITIRESKNQLNDLIGKLQYIQQRAKIIKNKLGQIDIKVNSQALVTNEKLLGNPQMQGSSIKTEVFDRKTQKPNHIIQTAVKLESIERMDQEGSTNFTGRQGNRSTNEELPLTGKGASRKRRSRQ